MSVTPGFNRYEVVLANKYYLRELLERITLIDSLDEISYRADVKLVVSKDFQQIGITNGQEIRVSGTPFGENSMKYLLHPGVVWEIGSATKGQKHMDITVYDRTIHLAKSEDEYLFPSGQTASQRLKKYASDWGIVVFKIPETGIKLSKAVYRPQAIGRMIMTDLKETVRKGGKMYRPRMTTNGLELFELGSNKTVWVLDEKQNIEEVEQKRTLERTVTQVKVLGKEEKDKRTPVLALLKGQTTKYGTLQKVLKDEKIKTAEEAKKAGSLLLSGVQESFTVTSIDINTIRAGDKVILNKMGLLVTRVVHTLGSPGRMVLELASESFVKRRYYYE